jgi:hypothetical protein
MRREAVHSLRMEGTRADVGDLMCCSHCTSCDRFWDFGYGWLCHLLPPVFPGQLTIESTRARFAQSD